MLGNSTGTQFDVLGRNAVRTSLLDFAMSEKAGGGSWGISLTRGGMVLVSEGFETSVKSGADIVKV